MNENLHIHVQRFFRIRILKPAQIFCQIVWLQKRENYSNFFSAGKTPEKDGPLGGALLSEVSTLFEMLMTQKADAHPGPRPEVLYRLSAAYRRSLGLDGSGATAAAGGGNAARGAGNAEKRSGLATTSELCQEM